ncbi:MAG: hypothetical protein WC756_04995 [Taibaiella sp.]|jgi:hypothetical protein
MTQERNYDIGDYVNYNGRFGNTVAKITDTQTSFDLEVPILYMYDRDEEITGEYKDIRPILTEEKHLSALGFTIQHHKGNPYYTLENIIVATISAKYNDPNSIWGTGYILCGLRAKLNQITEEEILTAIGSEYNEVTFSEVFAPAGFLMQLFDFLDQNGVEHDKETIALT